jgi:acetyl esterase/lipase
MKRYILFFYLCSFQLAFAQVIVDFDRIQSYPAAILEAQFGIEDAEQDVDLYRVTYSTIGSDGMPDTASGSVALPIMDNENFPILIYHHGTVNNRFDVPSQGSSESTVGLTGAAYGYVSLLPDYLGMGTSRGYHPYLHAETQARSAIDMLKAVSNRLDADAYNYSKRIFLTGYSQGGHASASTHFYLEQDPLDEFELVAAAHLSGPYDLGGITFETVLSDQPYLFVAYIPHVLMGMQEVYGNIFNQLEDIFKPQFADIISRLYNDAPLFDVNQDLIVRLLLDFGSSTPKFMLQDSTLANLQSNPNHPIIKALKDNTLTEWAPQIPTRLVYCMADEQVPFRNAIVADSIMNERGALDVDAINIDPQANHGGCVEPAFEYTLDFFDQFISTDQEEKIALAKARVKTDSEGIQIEFEDAIDRTVELYSTSGFQIMSENCTACKTLDITIGQSGLYVLRYSNRNKEFLSMKIPFFAE